jgi:hypothetical protein
MTGWFRMAATGVVAVAVGCGGASSVTPTGKVDSTEGMKPQTTPGPPGEGKLPAK